MLESASARDELTWDNINSTVLKNHSLAIDSKFATPQNNNLSIKSISQSSRSYQKSWNKTIQNMFHTTNQIQI